MKERPSGEDNCHLAGNREGFPGGAVVKNPPANAGDAKVGSIPGWGRSPGVGNGNLHRILAWKIPWTEEPGRLRSLVSQKSGTRLNNCTQHRAGNRKFSVFIRGMCE